MSIIGTFVKRGNDLCGAIRTLTLDVDLVVRPSGNQSFDGPDFLIYAAGTAKGSNGIDTQLGVGWRRARGQNHESIDVELDDPAFSSPLYATLVQDNAAPNGERFSLVWARARPVGGIAGSAPLEVVNGDAGASGLGGGRAPNHLTNGIDRQ